MTGFQCCIILKRVNEGHITILNVNYEKKKQISLYCRFNKIIKGPRTSFQSPALNQKHLRNVFHTAH